MADNTGDKGPIRLTQYSRGAGCGCKIAPAVLEQILDAPAGFPDPRLLVGNSSRDDAAVYDLGNGTALVSSADFFMPIVDDAFAFGQIAAANAISDIYAMGARPLLAIALLGWPVEQLPPELAKKVLEGARDICATAGIPIGGGHSIDSREPFFGLSVNGTVALENLKRNDRAKEGDLIFLTKPIGGGILATAQKRDVLKPEDGQALMRILTSLNAVGERLGTVSGVTAMTDVTGFGLGGHLAEMAEGSGLTAILNYSRLHFIDNVRGYLSQRIIPDATYRNWNSYGNKIGFDKAVNVMEAFSLLPDPQTNGGLLIAVDPSAVGEVKRILHENGLEKFDIPVGVFCARGEKAIQVVA